MASTRLVDCRFIWAPKSPTNFANNEVVATLQCDQLNNLDSVRLEWNALKSRYESDFTMVTVGSISSASIRVCSKSDGASETVDSSSASERVFSVEPFVVKSYSFEINLDVSMNEVAPLSALLNTISPIVEASLPSTGRKSTSENGTVVMSAAVSPLRPSVAPKVGADQKAFFNVGNGVSPLQNGSGYSASTVSTNVVNDGAVGNWLSSSRSTLSDNYSTAFDRPVETETVNTSSSRRRPAEVSTSRYCQQLYESAMDFSMNTDLIAREQVVASSPTVSAGRPAAAVSVGRSLNVGSQRSEPDVDEEQLNPVENAVADQDVSVGGGAESLVANGHSAKVASSYPMANSSEVGRTETTNNGTAVVADDAAENGRNLPNGLASIDSSMLLLEAEDELQRFRYARSLMSRSNSSVHSDAAGNRNQRADDIEQLRNELQTVRSAHHQLTNEIISLRTNLQPVQPGSPLVSSTPRPSHNDNAVSFGSLTSADDRQVYELTLRNQLLSFELDRLRDFLQQSARVEHETKVMKSQIRTLRNEVDWLKRQNSRVLSENIRLREQLSASISPCSRRPPVTAQRY